MDTRPVKDFSAAECQPFLLEGGRHGVVLFHGFTGSAGHMRPLGEALNAQGFTVRGINLPGHASSMEDMARFTWQDWLQAAKTAVLEMKERCPRVSVAGLSMGGDLALIVAEQMQVTACVPISAPMAVKNRLMFLARPASMFVKTILWKGDPERAAMLDQRYDYGYPGFPTRTAADLNHLIHLARRNLHAVTCPVLAVQSHADETVSEDSAEVIVRGVSSKKKGVLWLEEVPHVCTLSREVGNIAQAMGELLCEAERD